MLNRLFFFVLNSLIILLLRF